MVTVGRPINGITLNPLEYLLDAKNRMIAFDHEEQAKNFLKRMGFSKEEIYFCTIEDCMMSCMSCRHEFVLEKLYRDKLGWHTVCPECESSFDTEIVPLRNRSRKALTEEQKGKGEIE